MTKRLIRIFAVSLFFSTLTILACAHYPSGDEQTEDDAGTPPDGGTCTANCDPGDGGTPACDDDGDCPDGNVCTGGVCEPPVGNPDGGTGGGSDGGTGGGSDGGTGGGSDGGMPPECTVDSDCPPGKACEGGVCVCDGDGDDGGDNACKAGKVLLCHYPPGHPANRHAICVGAPAVPAHEAHGDTLGTCP